MREKRGEKVGEGEGEEKKLRTKFVKMYSLEELGEKLRMLRPEKAEKGGKGWFSMEELNLRLAKLREMEDKEAESRTGYNFSDLRQSLEKIKDRADTKKSSGTFIAFYFEFYAFRYGCDLGFLCGLVCV